MDEAQHAAPGGAAPASVWGRLRAAREAAGLSMPELASRTRVTQRYLEALENGRPNDLPSPTYASGFAKAYARAVGLDEVAVGRDVREEIARIGAPVRHYNIQEIADPARGPSRRLVVITAGLALAVLVLGLLWFATGIFRGTSDSAPSAAPSEATSRPAAAALIPAATQGGGPVVLTASDTIWLRIYDAGGKRLFEGTMKPGDRFQVPGEAVNPMINVGRPDKLSITVGGQPVAPLGDGKRALKNVPISAASLLGRGAPTVATTPSSLPTTQVAPTNAPTASVNPTARSAAPTPRASSSAKVPRAFASPTAASTPRTATTTAGAATPAAKAASIPNPVAPAATPTSSN